MTQSILSDIVQNCKSELPVTKCAVLTTQNERVQLFNQTVEWKVPGTIKTVLSEYSVKEAEPNKPNYSIELLSSERRTALLLNHVRC